MTPANRWAKDIVFWKTDQTLYLSVVFTWLLPKAQAIAEAHKGRVIAGGPAVKLMGAPWADETQDTTAYDVLSAHNPFATFTTRGCIRKCRFCAVPKIEGNLMELDDWKPAPIVCDNNLLASSDSHLEKVINSLRPFPCVDFNQGLDARLFNSEHARLISRVLRKPKIRFSFDHADQEPIVSTAIDRARRAGLKDIGVYVLVGFDDAPEEALYKLETVKKWGIRPNPMRYQPLDSKEKNNYVRPPWTANELRRVTRYYSNLRYFEHISYENYRGGQPGQTDLWNCQTRGGSHGAGI